MEKQILIVKHFRGQAICQLIETDVRHDIVDE